MVTRILKYELTLTANTTDQELDSKSPRDGQVWEVQELFTDQLTDADDSLTLNERKLFDNIPAEDLPNPDNGLPLNIRVQSGDDLAVLASETAGNTNTHRVYIVVDESGG